MLEESTPFDAQDRVVIVRTPRASSRWVYGVRFGRWTKIGVSVDPRDRLSHIRRGGVRCPDDIDWADVEPIFLAHGEGDTERLLHAAFDQYRGMGEWFALPEGVLDSLRRHTTDSDREKFGKITALERELLPAPVDF